MKKKISIGLVVDNLLVSSWAYELVKKLIKEQVGEVSYIVVLPGGQTAFSANVRESKIQRFHMDLDKKHFKPSPDAFERKELDTLIPGAPIVPSEAYIKSQKKMKSDFLIWLSDESPESVYYDHVNYGILTYVHGDQNSRSSVYGYQEFVERRGVITSSLLLKKHNDQAGKVIYQTWSMMPSMSMSRPRNEHFWKLLSFVPRVLKVFAREGEEGLLKQAELINKEPPSKRKALSEIKAFINLCNHFCRLVHKARRKFFFREQWLFLFHNNQEPSTSFEKFKMIYPPKDRFWADPILIQKEQKNYLFFEELPYATNRGYLSVVELDENGLSGPVTPILEKPYHLSYPFIFQLEGTYYMIPESFENKNVQLYECSSFPFEWKFKMELMKNICAFDTTLFYYNKKWWMFTLLSENQGSGHNDELFLYFADTPFTQDWKSHSQNPIISDVRRARPAGSIYIDDGKIIRPSQDCSRKYGYGFNLNEIEVLTETEYREKQILHVQPNWDKKIKRTHSYAHQPGISVIDALIQRPRFF